MNWYGVQAGEGFEYQLLALGLAVPLIVRGGGAWAIDSALRRALHKARVPRERAGRNALRASPQSHPIDKEVEMNVITRKELQASMSRGDPVVLLEALPEKYYRHGHLPGAKLLPHDQATTLAPLLVPARDTAIVVYCASRAARDFARLRLPKSLVDCARRGGPRFASDSVKERPDTPYGIVLVNPRVHRVPRRA